MAERRYLVISGLGPDRPGLVAEVTDYISARGGNVEDSRMAVLGGEFGVAVLVSGAEDSIARLRRDSAELHAKTGLDFVLHPTVSPETHRKATVVPCLITAQALDQEGIVRSISAALHRAGINIVSLDTVAYNAPVTGSPLFRLEARVDMPRGVGIADVRRAMQEIGRSLDIDIDVRSLA
jgi:glycine cleavage system transcriptional repressor